VKSTKRLWLLAGAAATYVLAAWTVAPGFYDGFGPPQPYNWTCPPPQAGANQKPSSAHLEINVIGGVSDANSAFTNDGQLQQLDAPSPAAPSSRVDTTYLYDGDGRLTETDTPAGFSTKSTFLSDGLLATSVDGRGLSTSYSYDADGHQSIVTQPDGVMSTTQYYSDERVRCRPTAAQDAPGNAYTGTTQETTASRYDPDGNTTTMAYDVLGRLISRTDALNHTATMAYDSGGRMTSTTDALGRVRDLSFDALNRETGETWVVSGATTDTLTFNFGKSFPRAISAVANRLRFGCLGCRRLGRGRLGCLRLALLVVQALDVDAPAGEARGQARVLAVLADRQRVKPEVLDADMAVLGQRLDRAQRCYAGRRVPRRPRESGAPRSASRPRRARRRSPECCPGPGRGPCSGSCRRRPPWWRCR